MDGHCIMMLAMPPSLCLASSDRVSSGLPVVVTLRLKLSIDVSPWYQKSIQTCGQC